MEILRVKVFEWLKQLRADGIANAGERPNLNAVVGCAVSYVYGNEVYAKEKFIDIYTACFTALLDFMKWVGEDN